MLSPRKSKASKQGAIPFASVLTRLLAVEERAKSNVAHCDAKSEDSKDAKSELCAKEEKEEFHDAAANRLLSPGDRGVKSRSSHAERTGPSNAHSGDVSQLALLQLGDEATSPARVDVKGMLAVGLVKGKPTFVELTRSLSTRLCMLDVRLLDTATGMRGLCVRSLSQRVMINGRICTKEGWEQLNEGDALSLGHWDGDARTIYAVTYAGGDALSHQHAVAVAFARDALSKYDVEASAEALDEAKVGSILCPNGGASDSWSVCAKRARDELLAVQELCQAIQESAQQRFMAWAKDEAAGHGVNLGTYTEAALKKVALAVAQEYKETDFELPPETYWAAEGLVKCHQVLTVEAQHAGELEKACDQMRQQTVCIAQNSQKDLGAVMIERVVQTMVDEFADMRALDPDENFKDLVDHVWESYGLPLVMTYIPGTSEWTKFHLGLRKKLNDLGRSKRLDKKLGEFFLSLRGSRGDHLALDIYDRALALALARGHARAVDIVLDSLRSRNEIHMETFRIWALHAHRSGSWPEMSAVIKATLGEDLEGETLLDDALLSLVELLQRRCLDLVQRRESCEQCQADESDLSDQDLMKGLTQEFAKASRAEVEEDEEEDLDTGMQSPDVIDDSGDESCAADDASISEREEGFEDDDDGDEDDFGSEAAEFDVDDEFEDAGEDELSEGVTDAEGQVSTPADDRRSWYWLCAMADDLPSKLARVKAGRNLEERIVDRTNIDKDRLNLVWEHSVVFYDCPPLIGFQSNFDADRAVEALKDLRLTKCQKKVLPALPQLERRRRVRVQPPSPRSNVTIRPVRNIRSRDEPAEDSWRAREDSDVEFRDTEECLCDPQRLPHAALDRCGVMVVYKPAYWTVTTGADGKKQKCASPPLQSWLIKEFRRKHPFLVDNHRAGLVHRLDVQTSGPILVGTRPGAFAELTQSLHKKSWYKEYLALMHGAVPASRATGVLKYRLLKKPDGFGWRTEVNSKKGEHAETRYEAIAVFRRRHTESMKTQRYTLMRVRIITGKTHQIRVHLAELARELHFPICGLVGDYKYLPYDQVRADASICSRVFLHAAVLEFPPPRNYSANKVKVKCPLPQELKRTLKKLEKDDTATKKFRQADGDDKDFLRDPGDQGSPPTDWLKDCLSGRSPSEQWPPAKKARRAPPWRDSRRGNRW